MTDNGYHGYRVETSNQDGAVVISNGWAEVSQA